jgi:hypothetical protein
VLLCLWDVGRSRRGNIRERILFVLAACVWATTIAVGIWPLASNLRDQFARQRAAPMLMPFDEPWLQRYLWIDAGVTFRTGEIPNGWPADAGANVARIRVPSDEPFPGIGVHEPFPDWRGYATFALDVFNPGTEPLALGLRIEDFHHNTQYYDRFNRALSIEPGFQTVRIALDEVERGPRQRRLFMSRMNGFKLFAIRPQQPVEFFLGNVRLE